MGSYGFRSCSVSLMTLPIAFLIAYLYPQKFQRALAIFSLFFTGSAAESGGQPGQNRRPAPGKSLPQPEGRAPTAALTVKQIESGGGHPARNLRPEQIPLTFRHDGIPASVAPIPLGPGAVEFDRTHFARGTEPGHQVLSLPPRSRKLRKRPAGERRIGEVKNRLLLPGIRMVVRVSHLDRKPFPRIGNRVEGAFQCIRREGKIVRSGEKEHRQPGAGQVTHRVPERKPALAQFRRCIRVLVVQLRREFIERPAAVD